MPPNENKEEPKQVLGSYAASKGASVKDVKKCSCKNGKTSNGETCPVCKGDGLVGKS